MWNPFLQITLFGFGLLSSFSGAFWWCFVCEALLCIYFGKHPEMLKRTSDETLFNEYLCVLEIFISNFAEAELLCLQHEKYCNHGCVSPFQPPGPSKRTLHTFQRKSAWKKLYSSFIHAFYLFRLRFSTSYAGWSTKFLQLVEIVTFWNVNSSRNSFFSVGDWNFPSRIKLAVSSSLPLCVKNKTVKSLFPGIFYRRMKGSNLFIISQSGWGWDVVSSRAWRCQPKCLQIELDADENHLH